MEIKPSIAHRMAELSKEIAEDIKNSEYSDYLQSIYETIRSAVFRGKTSCSLSISTSFTNKDLRAIKRILKKQKFSCTIDKILNKIIIRWKRSWLISVLKLHQ